MPTEIYVDVLVVGAGPAGLLCANALVRGGIKVKIIDKSPTKVAVGQAAGVMSRSVEVLQSYGLAERLCKEGGRASMRVYYKTNPVTGGIQRTIRRIDQPAKPSLRSPYPFGVRLHQGAIESIFLDSMAEHGLQVCRPYAPTSMEISENEEQLKDHQAHPIKATIKKLDAKDGEEDIQIVHAKYCVGTDGAHSWVRKYFGIKMEGEQTNAVWAVVDTKVTSNFPDIRNTCYIQTDSGTIMMIPRENDTIRVYTQLADIPLAVGGRVAGKYNGTGPREVLETVKKALLPYTASFKEDVDWWAPFIVGQRVAATYAVKNRVYLSGDACHTHSPKAGQGMNAGFNDSHNLAWKLAHVLRGWAPSSLLDNYEFERRKFAQDLIEFDKKLSKAFGEQKRKETNDENLQEAMARLNEQFASFTSGTGITYGASGLVDATYQSVAANLVIGQRLPPQIIVRSADGHSTEIQDLLPADFRHKVIILAGDSSSASQITLLKRIADHLDEPSGFVKRFTPQGLSFDAVFDIVSITNTNKFVVNYNDVPERLWSHWSKVFTDDETFGGGGKLYESYGVSPEGGIVMVRPDGFVGFVAPLSVHGAEAVGQYLGGFMTECIL